MDSSSSVKFSFTYKDQVHEGELSKTEAWEVAQALKRMNPYRLKAFQEKHRYDEPYMMDGFEKIRLVLNSVGIDPR